MLTQAVTQTADSVVIVSIDGRIQFVNPAFEQLTGFSAAEAIGCTPALVKSGTHSLEFFAALWKVIIAGEVFRGVITNRRKNGTLYHEEKTITPIRNKQGVITHFVSTGRDVSDRLLATARFEYLANHDVLTGLPNRALFMDRLAQAVLRSQREQTSLALLFVDVDHFKAINDGFGHSAGDEVLIEVGSRLRSAVRDEDSVARLGGDEFTVIVEGLKHPADSSRVGQAIIAAFKSPFLLNGQSLQVGVSIGIASFPDDSDDVDTLLKHADMAMFCAKASGRNTSRHFGEAQR